MQQQDSELAARCRQLADTVRNAGKWLEDNRDLVGSEYAVLQKDLRAAARFFGKHEMAARRKMCVGVFGPSQSGKSYLISAMARNAQGSLMADFGGTSHDFISEINPEGGKESTGLVTRFTTDAPAPGTPPVHLRLLSQFDVARILANTYYADCEHKEQPDAGKVTGTLDRLQARASSDVLCADAQDQMEDMREYVNRNFISRARVQMLQNGYWGVATELAPHLGTQDRLELLGIIWDSQPRFQDLFRRLCTALDQLGNPQEACCSIDALIPRTTSIIDVTLLNGLEQDGTDRLTVQGVPGKTVELPRALITALTAEITIHMKDKPDDFFDYTDLLDFPGYRSRLKLEDLDNELDRPGTLANLFLRGKVAYLFERYRMENELTSMLLCIGPGNQEVQDLPRAVYEWICSTHGENPASRTGIPSLFFILTKMDMEFEQKQGAPSVETRWTTRLQSSLVDFFGKQHDWPAKWDGTHPFNNVFLLRNPNFKCVGIFDFAGDRETGVRADQLEFVRKVKQAFLASELVHRHVANPEQVWEAAMTLNDGGVELLRHKLRPLCNPELKRRQIQVTVAERTRQVVNKLSPFFHRDDPDGRREEKQRLSRELATVLASVATNQRFGEFLRCLQVRDHDIYEIGLQARAPERADAPLPQPAAGTRISVNDILGEVFGDGSAPADPQPAPPPGDAPEPKPAKDKHGIFAQMIMDHWTSSLNEVCNDPQRRQDFGMEERQLDQFRHELITIASRNELQRKMEERLRKDASYANITRERLLWKQAATATDAINAFIDWLGYDPRSKSKEERTIISGDKTTSLFDPPAPFTGEPPIGDNEPTYSKTWCIDWLRAFTTGIMDNCDLNDHSVDPAQNTRLGDIIRSLGS